MGLPWKKKQCNTSSVEYLGSTIWLQELLISCVQRLREGPQFFLSPLDFSSKEFVPLCYLLVRHAAATHLLTECFLWCVLLFLFTLIFRLIGNILICTFGQKKRLGGESSPSVVMI